MTRLGQYRIGLLLATAALAACGTHDGAGGGGGGADGGADGTLTIGPPSSMLTINNGVPATEMFTATLTHADGTAEDVTASTVFSVDNAAGSFAGNTLSLEIAGQTTITGLYQGATGTATVIARAKSVRIDPAVPANAPNLFAGSDDPSRAPTIVYPSPGVVMPRNLGAFEIHWNDTAGNDVFEISLHSTYSDVYAYVPVTTPASWAAFTPDEWAQGIAQDTSISYQVRGVLSTNPVGVGATPLQTVTVTNEQMLGGLYYWESKSTSGSGDGGIYRHDMGKPDTAGEQYMTTVQTGGRCVACHVLSRDGSKMAVTFDGGDQVATFVDVATLTTQPIVNSWNFGAFTADGNQFFSVEGGVMVLRNYADQSIITTVATSGPASHPDVSKDGTMLTYVIHDANQEDFSFTGGTIVTRTFDQASSTFGPETPLVTTAGPDDNNYYPSWSPDGQWILFNKATDGGSSYNDVSTQLYVVKADGSAPPIALTTMNSAANLTNSWGRWAPFAQTLGGTGESMFWITVSSKRDFGIRIVNSATDPADQTPQIWMTAFFPDRASTGADPSVPAFRLPFQDVDGHNHIAQWTEQVVTVD